MTENSNSWHSMALKEVETHLGTSADTGLSKADVEERQQRYGPNRLPEIAPLPPWHSILEVQATPQGLLFTMPVSYPDGWQVVLELQQVTPKHGGSLTGGRRSTGSWGKGSTCRLHSIHASHLKAQALQPTSPRTHAALPNRG